MTSITYRAVAAQAGHRGGVCEIDLRVKTLARHLTRQFDGRVPKRRLAALRRRTQRILTQGHLAQHVLYHSFHGPAIPAHAEQLFGITRDAFSRRASRASLQANSRSA